MPFNSYIDVFNFTTAEKLANYLKAVGSDEKLYNSYFEWKTSHCVRNKGYTYFCALCEKLNNPSNMKNHYKRNLTDWYFKQANCNSVNIENYF